MNFYFINCHYTEVVTIIVYRIGYLMDTFEMYMTSVGIKLFYYDTHRSIYYNVNTYLNRS